jgi:hypothetical protein
MTIARARGAISLVFSLGFSVQSAGIFYTWLQGAIYPDDVTNFVLKLLSIYSVHLTVIIAGIFAQYKREVSPFSDLSLSFWLALAVSSIWNLLLVVRTMIFVFGSHDSINDVVTYLTTISSAGSFLVAGALTYFFSQRRP